MSLTEQINKGKTQVIILNPYEAYSGPIPKTVPAMRKDGRSFAGGNKVLEERLGALRSKDKESIAGWGENYYDMADACVTFEDLVKLQTDSGFLKGIRGVAPDGSYVAVDADAVRSAVSEEGMKYFNVAKSANVVYLRQGKPQQETVENVVLLPYNISAMKLTADQFNAVAAKAIKRKDIVNGRDMEKGEIIEDGKIIHPAWGVYNPEVIAPLVDETFEFNGKEYHYDKNMGVFLPSETKNEAEMRALCVGRLYLRSGLFGLNDLGDGKGRSLGVVENVAAGDGARKIDPIYAMLLSDAIEGKAILRAADADYVKSAERLPAKQ